MNNTTPTECLRQSGGYQFVLKKAVSGHSSMSILVKIILYIFLSVLLVHFETNVYAIDGISSNNFGIISGKEVKSLTAPETAGKTVLVSSVMDAGNVAIPQNRSIRFVRGGGLNIGQGKQIDFNNSLPEAGRYQIFFGPGAIANLPEVYPEWFGAKGDGVTDDSQAFQKAMRALSRKVGSRFTLTAGRRYYLSSSVDLPKQFGSHVSVVFDGYGSELFTDRPISMFRRLPKDQQEALRIIGVKFIFRGIKFSGTGLRGQKGLELAATYGSVVESCEFENLDVGCDLIFCLMATVRNCTATNNRSQSFVARTGTGVWEWANLNNSQSNLTRFESCRVYNREGADSAFAILGSDGVVLEECVSEGSNPKYSVYFDTQGRANMTVKAFSVLGFHNECNPAKAVIKLLATGGQMIIERLYHQMPAIAIDVAGSYSTCVVNVRHMTYIPKGVMFRHDDSNPAFPVKWEFFYSGDGSTTDITNPAIWHKGVVPAYLTVFRYDDKGSPVPLFESASGLNIKARSMNIATDNGDIVVAPASGRSVDVRGSLTVRGRIEVPEPKNASKAGKIIKKIPIYNDKKEIIGYVPVYDSME